MGKIVNRAIFQISCIILEQQKSHYENYLVICKSLFRLIRSVSPRMVSNKLDETPYIVITMALNSQLSYHESFPNRIASPKSLKDTQLAWVRRSRMISDEMNSFVGTPSQICHPVKRLIWTATSD